MQDVIDAHLTECDEAWTVQNLAITAATQQFETAVRDAQVRCADALTESRKKAWDTIQARLFVWNGAELPKATQLTTGHEQSNNDTKATLDFIEKALSNDE